VTVLLPGGAASVVVAMPVPVMVKTAPSMSADVVSSCATSYSAPCSCNVSGVAEKSATGMPTPATSSADAVSAGTTTV
jgi:hypothetical protein